MIVVIAISSACPVFFAYPQSSATDRRTFGAASCRVETPTEWNSTGPVTWIGGCKHGYADGLGVLRRTDPGYPTDLFLGRVDQGFLRSGATDRDGSYKVGCWDGGTVLPPGDDLEYRNKVIDAWRNAAKAADATARYMRSHANPKAARFYTHLAKVMRMQDE